jgi:hypothetical protein
MVTARVSWVQPARWELVSRLTRVIKFSFERGLAEIRGQKFAVQSGMTLTRQ